MFTRQNLPVTLVIGGIVVIAFAYFYQLLAHGMPVDDPPASMAAHVAPLSPFALIVGIVGGVVTLAGLVLAIVMVATKRHG